MLTTTAAGLATVEALRRKGYAGRVTVLGAEAHLPYDRPPLSKQVLGGSWAPGQTQLRTPAALSALDTEFVLGDPAVRLDAGARTVHTAAGRTLTADAVVLATGLRPRTVHGARIFADTVPAPTLDTDPQAVDDLLALERAAAEMPDYLAVATLLHVLAERG